MGSRVNVIGNDRVHFTSSQHGFKGGMYFDLDHTNNLMEIVDKDGNFPTVKLPALLAPSVWLETDWGWEKSGTNVIGYANGNKIIEFSETHIAFYDNGGTKQFHMDLTTGNLFIKGYIRTDGIDFP